MSNKLQPSRELDALVAERVMEWDWYTIVGVNILLPPDHHYRRHPVLAEPGKNGREDDIESLRFYDSTRGGHTMPIVPRFHEDIGAAWRVIERMLAQDDQELFLRFVAAVGELGGLIAPAHTAAYRICLAALKASGRH